MTDTGEVSLIDRPVQWAASDGAGGVLFTDWNPHRFGPTWWLAAGAEDPVAVSEWDDPLLAARVDGRPAAVGPLPTDTCQSDGGVDMVARILDTGETVPLQCGVGGPDAGQEPNSFGGGMFVGVEWDAVHVSGRSTAIALVFRDERGEVIDLPTNPHPDDCSPCELTAALSPDGSRLAVIHRPDAGPSNSEFYEDWLVDTASVAADVRVVDLTNGETLFDETVQPGARPSSQTWFDGRYVVLGPDRFTHPTLTRGDTGDRVRELQARLIDVGADIELDGTFGPGTEAAVEAFHTERFGSPRRWVGPDTWTELGVPDTILDTLTGRSIERRGAIALETDLTDAPAARPTVDPVELATIAILRVEGIGPYVFGDDADDVERLLIDELGSADETIDEPGALGWPIESCNQRRAAYWADSGLTVVFADRGPSGDCTPTPHIAAWMLYDAPPWFATDHGDDRVIARQITTDTGIGLGSTAIELRTAHPDVEFGEWDIDEYSPGSFRIDNHLQGRLDWNGVIDVQRALNDRGATLDVDGLLGAATRQAVVDFQQTAAITEIRPDGDGIVGVIGPATLTALGIDPPADAPITFLAAGNWAWDF